MVAMTTAGRDAGKVGWVDARLFTNVNLQRRGNLRTWQWWSVLHEEAD